MGGTSARGLGAVVNFFSFADHFRGLFSGFFVPLRYVTPRRETVPSKPSFDSRKTIRRAFLKDPTNAGEKDLRRFLPRARDSTVL